MAFAWYTPTLVQFLGTHKNTDINTNLTAIQTAFNNQNAWLTLTSVSGGAGLVIGTTGPRNVLVDMTGLINIGGTASITLPVGAIGDPPCTVAVLAAGYANTFNLFNGTTTILPQGGQKIMGSASIAPILTNAGDIISLVYIGGVIGWIYNVYNVQPAVNPTGTILFGPISDLGQASPRLDAVLDVTATSTPNPTTLKVDNLSQGQFFAITLRSPNGGKNINIGTAGATFNGVAGPYVISVTNTRYLFTCTAVNAFTVTTA